MIRMPAKTNRKIMKHGSSGVIAVPSDYRQYHNLKPGDNVEVLYDSLLLIVPEKLKHIADKKRELIDKLLS